MSDDMVERVARAMFDVDVVGTASDHPGTPVSLIRLAAEALFPHYEAMARAAIEAMREPTAEMYKAGTRLVSHFFRDYNVEFTEYQIDELWPAMIDAALAPPTDTEVKGG